MKLLQAGYSTHTVHLSRTFLKHAEQQHGIEVYKETGKKIHLSLHRDLDTDRSSTVLRAIPSFFKDLRTNDLFATATSTTC